MLRAPIWKQSTYFSISSTCRVSMTSTQMGMPSSSPQARIHFSGLLAEPLKRIGAGAGLVDAAAKDGGPAVADVAGDGPEHLFIFNRAWPGDTGGMGAADLMTGDLPPPI